MSAAPEASNPNIFDLQEAATAAAKGPQFTGWHNNLFFVGGVCSQRIAGWIKAAGIRQKAGGGQ